MGSPIEDKRDMQQGPVRYWSAIAMSSIAASFALLSGRHRGRKHVKRQQRKMLQTQCFSCVNGAFAVAEKWLTDIVVH